VSQPKPVFRKASQTPRPCQPTPHTPPRPGNNCPNTRT